MLKFRDFHSPEEDRSDEIQYKDDGNGDGGHVHGAVRHPGGELIEEGLDAVEEEDPAEPEAEYEVVATDESTAEELTEAVEAVEEAAAEEAKE